MTLFYLVFFLVVGYLLYVVLKLQSHNTQATEEYEVSVIQSEEVVEVKAKSQEEIFALALGDLEHERLENALEELELSRYLEQTWGLSFEAKKSKEHTLYTLQQLWSKGTLSLVLEHQHLRHQVSIADMVAFDSSRFVELLRQVIYLKFIDEEEAWGLLFLNAQRVQDSYANWEAFQEAYFRGLSLYAYSQLSEKEQKSFDFNAVFHTYQQNSKVKVAWLEEKIFSNFKKVKI